MAAAPSLREGGRQRSKDGSTFRRSSPAWGEGTGRSQDGSRPPRREYQDKPQVERAPTAPELDNQWRSKMRPDAPAKSPTPSRDPSNPPSPASAMPPAPATRPRLNLQKRTVSEADPGPSPTTSTSAPESKASPFGAARPVDTSSKEKEIEEKRQIAMRQRKEAEEKARAEKAEERRLAKEAKEAKDKAPAEKGSMENVPTVEKENGAEIPQTGQNFEILRRANESANGMTEDESEAEGETAIAPADDKAVKPRETVRDVPSALAQEGSWRGQNSQENGSSVDDTAKKTDEDGWSTVSNTKQRNNRRSNQAARAIAS